MVKALLADADADSLRSFKAYIRMSTQDVRVVGSIGAYQSLQPIVREFQPDVIIADIRFFGVYAVQVIRDLHETFPDLRFIIYGTYNDAEYVEKVLEFGVIDYMYRPITPAELERCLKRANKAVEEIALMNAAKKRLIDDYKNEIESFKLTFLSNLLGGILENESEIATSLRYFGLTLPPPYTVFHVRVDHFKTIILTLDEMEKHMLIYQILMIVKEKLARRGDGIAVISRFNELSVIASGPADLYELIEFCEDLKTDILYQTHFPVTIGVGRTYDLATQIVVSSREADAALHYRYYMGYNAVIPIHFVDPLNDVTYHYPKEKEEALVYAAVTGEYEYCEILLRKLIDALKERSSLPERHVPKIMMHVLIAIARYAGEQHMPNDNMFTKFFNSKEIFKLKTLDDAYRYLSGALKNFCGFMVETRNASKKQLVADVKAYINEHCRENISLANMAKIVKTTPEFLSAIFKEAEGTSIYVYATRLKLERAKTLMATPMDDEAIAADVGYDDVRLFRNLFKQQTGLFTHEYRTQVMKL